MNKFANMLTLIGVNLTNADGSYRSLDSILNDISKVWNKLTLDQREVLSNEFVESLK